MKHIYYVYIMANWTGSTLYIGVTNNIQWRVYQHRAGIGSAFSRKYNTTKLVYYEEFRYIYDAIQREKQLKGWRRSKKDALIDQMNIDRADLSRNWEY